MSSDADVIQAAGDYDLILTLSDAVCDAVDHAELFPFGSRWVPRGETVSSEGISFIFSEGSAPHWRLAGYEQRVEVMQRILADPANTIPVYYSTQRPMRDSSRDLVIELFSKRRGQGVYGLTDQKLPALTSRYQIVIENESARNFFTEKIVDCLARKVVPIYIGCPNIGDFFDTRGIVACTSVDEVFAAVARIYAGERLYDPDALAINQELTDQYEDVRGRARTVIETAIARKARHVGKPE